jgi:hypothetical protein
MADTSIFAKLKRLFSSQSVIRHTGGKRLKVADTSMTQGYGSRNQIDRYRRVTSGGQYGYQAQGGHDTKAAFHQARLQLFRDYELMDADPIVSSVLDIYADECTVKNEFGEVLVVNSDNDDVKDILKNLFYDVLNIEFNMYPWARSMCKYGDFYLYLMIDPKFGIVNTLPLSVYETQRIEGDAETGNPFKVEFIVNSEYEMYAGKTEFDNYEVAHFRLLSDGNFLPYGRSIIEGGRRIYKQLRLMEDAMLIHRITRAPDKRKIRIDVGNIPPGEVETYMGRVQDGLKRQPLVDATTGDYNMRYNIQNILEDFFIPVRGKDSGTDIENLGGLTYSATEDIDYLLKKLLSAFRVPNSFIGYEEDTSGKATLAAQDVRFARTVERVQKVLVSELNKIAMVHLYVLGYRDAELLDFNLSLVSPSTIYELEKINLWKERMSLADQMLQSRLFSREWIYNNVFDTNDEEMLIEQDNIIEDARFEGQVQKAVQDMLTPDEGEGGQAPGAPVEEDSDFSTKEKSIDDMESFTNNRPVGRPPEGIKYKTDRHPRGRDPLAHSEILGAMKIIPTKMDSSIRETLKGLDANVDFKTLLED